MRAARFRPGACLVLALVAVLVGGTRQAAAVPGPDLVSTPPSAVASTAPLDPSPGTLLTVSVVVTPGANPTSTGLYVNCDLSWLGIGPSAPLFDDGTHGDPTAGDLTFTVQATIPSGAVPGTRLGDCGVFDAESRSGSTSYSVNVVTAVRDVGPTVVSTVPLSDATDVATDANVTISFSEAVDVADSWSSISCSSSGAHLASVTGGPQSYLLDPASDFAAGELCTVTITAAKVTDQDTIDPPDAMGSDSMWSFTTTATPPLNEPPSVSAGGPYSVDEGLSVTVTASGTDPESGSLQYAWDLDNDGTFETAGQTATFSATAIDGRPATRTIAVRVTDDSGLTATDTATVTIANVAPVATFNAPAASPAGFPFTLSLTNAHDPSAADTSAGLEYAFDCGTGYGAFGKAASASCPTTDVGVPSVGGKIRDNDGGVSEYRSTVSVFVTFSSLCDLVRSYSTDSKVADDLCDKLARAAAASTAGLWAAQLGAFANQVDAKTDKGLTPAQAAELKLLAGRL